MASMNMFNNPLMLGFENLERMMDQVAKASSESYPPYDIEQLDDTHTRITLAVAGFGEEDLNVQVEDNQLIIRGKQAPHPSDKERKFIYRGIASRQFQRVFVLADGMEIKGADLAKGLLKIDLERNEPEVKIKKIKINDLDNQKALQDK
ncbi:MAG: Hsp20 family protein [Alphaproteobacteria bacterium]|nr:Hsp20 family protein [Alphaproteobacteria bacterium]